jgi:eukaryotic-like serine/threonine-protein kinase
VSARPERARAYGLFTQALELQAEERAAFLQEQCGNDDLLRAEVEGLLGVALREGLDTGAFIGAAEQAPEELLAGHNVGRFRLIERVGEGGMGVVYRAERTDGVQQSVAIKLLTGALASGAQLRFEREVQLLARLEHPAIARLIDAGVDEGRAWMAIEFVRGERIDEYCRTHLLPPREIVRLLVRLTDAVAAAHGMLVVHSDIKPANVLVTAEGMPKLVDFGISTALREASLESPHTVAVGRLFTPNYAAPEQVSGGPVTVATDVFGLGALAYRLLTGVPPYNESRSAIAYLLAVTQRDVELPSRAALKDGRGPAMSRALRGDLDAILCKALERDPARRYPSAAALQADLKRYLDRRPVSARRQSLTYRLGKFVRRNAIASGLGALLLVSLIGGGLFAALQAHRAALARDMAARRGEFLETLLKSANPGGGRRDISVAELLDSATPSLDQTLGGEPLVEASMLGLIADTYNGLGRYAEGLAASERQLALLRANGASSLEISKALLTQGELLREEGRWKDDEPVVREAIGRLRALDAPAELCTALDLLGIVQAHTYRTDEAVATYREEIAIESTGNQSLRNRRIYPYQALEAIALDQGRYAQAVEYGREDVELAEAALRADHPDLLAMRVQYASTLVSSGNAAEGERLARETNQRQARVLGVDHKDTLLSDWIIADALVELHRDEEAATIAQAAALKLDTLLGPDSPYSLAAWQVYAIASCDSGHFGEGLMVMRRVAEARARLLPPGDSLVHFAGLGIGICLFRAGQYDEAESALLAATKGLETTRGPQFRRTRQGYRALQDLYLAMNRPEDARRYADKLH